MTFDAQQSPSVKAQCQPKLRGGGAASVAMRWLAAPSLVYRSRQRQISARGTYGTEVRHPPAFQATG